MRLKQQIKKVVLRLFPELTGGYHLPKLAEVIALREYPNGTIASTDFRATLTADVRLLDEQLQPQLTWPILEAVPMVVQGVSDLGGTVQPLQEGNRVIVQFANGLPSAPMITGVLPQGQILPNTPLESSHQGAGPEAYQSFNRDGEIKRIADHTIDDNAVTITQHCLEHVIHTAEHYIHADESSIEKIVGAKIVEAMSAILIVSGDHMQLGSNGTFYVESAKAGELKAPEWAIGDGEIDLLEQVSNLANEVAAISEICNTHVHPKVAAPVETPWMKSKEAAASIKNNVDIIRGEAPKETAK